MSSSCIAVVVGVLTLVSVVTAGDGDAQAAAAVPTSPPQLAISSSLDFFDDLLFRSQQQFLQLVSSESGGGGSCNINHACPSPIIPFYNLSNAATSIPVSADFTQVKVNNGTSPSSSSSLAPVVTTNVCAIGGMTSSWREQFSNASSGSIAFQYYAGADNQFGVFPARNWDCAKTYTPTLRPYYVSGATGQKDLVILIDVSTMDPNSVERIGFAKKATIGLLNTLSFRDYVAVFPYDHQVSYAVSGSDSLLQATSNNIASLIDNIEELFRPGGGAFNPNSNKTRADLNSALKAAFSIFNSSTASTSSCTKTVVLLSSGRSDATNGGGGEAGTASASAPVSTYVTNGMASVVFSFVLVANNTHTPAAPLTNLTVSPNVTSGIPARLSCVSKGVFRAVNILSSAADPVDLVQSYNQYFTVLLKNSVVRWSEVYEDRFGQGKVVSGAFPVYGNGLTPGVTLPTNGDFDSTSSNVLLGMTVMDVPLGNLTGGSGGITTEESVNNYLLSSQTCTPLNYTDTAAIASLSYPKPDCGDSLDSEGQLPLRKWKPLIVVCSVILVLLFTLIPYRFAMKAAEDNYDEDGSKQALACGVLPFLICWLICLSIFWSQVYSDIVVREHFVPISYVVDSTAANPFRCCDIVNCRCASHYGSSCYAMRARLQAGPCDDGYYCCRRTCRSCNCHSTKKGGTSCSTCCHCAYSVNHQRCDVVCGTCYRPTAQVSYEYKQQLVQSQISTLCGRDDVACKDKFIEKTYSVGSIHTGFINPLHPEEIVASNSYRLNFFVPFLIFAILSAIPFFLMWRVYLRNRPSTPSASSPWMSGRGGASGSGGSTSLINNFDQRPSVPPPPKQMTAQEREDAMIRQQEADLVRTLAVTDSGPDELASMLGLTTPSSNTGGPSPSSAAADVGPPPPSSVPLPYPEMVGTRRRDEPPMHIDAL